MGSDKGWIFFENRVGEPIPMLLREITVIRSDAELKIRLCQMGNEAFLMPRFLQICMTGKKLMPKHTFGELSDPDSLFSRRIYSPTI
ncbi:MAG: hypothetical protein IPO07_16700 [Haliscomenobacter sp.]|nr:hypothetical protein [Haliscomenobacter sp.]MBK9490222.1 hypothetical protein [Haliscomenobacter sp.]